LEVPFRDAARFEPCAICDAPSQRACTCCRRPLCRAHIDRSSLCERCSDAYFRFRAQDSGDGILGRFALGLGLLAAGVAYAEAFAPVLVAFVVLGFPGLTWWHLARRKRRFLADVERRGARALLPPPADAGAGEPGRPGSDS
jgi:hypothetical protein